MARVSGRLAFGRQLLVQFAAYVDYLISEDKTSSITKLFFNSERFPRD